MSHFKLFVSSNLVSKFFSYFRRHISNSQCLVSLFQSIFYSKMNANLLFVINEKIVDLNEFDHFELRKVVNKQRLNGYFHFLHGPIYINLVKDFWMNVSVVPAGHDEVIQSYINGSNFFITPSL